MAGRRDGEVTGFAPREVLPKSPRGFPKRAREVLQFAREVLQPAATASSQQHDTRHLDVSIFRIAADIFFMFTTSSNSQQPAA